MNEKIKDTIQDCNLNFLIGSGLSSPYLKTLGNVESLLTELDRKPLTEEQDRLIRYSLYKKYFDGVMSKNRSVLKSDPEAISVLNAYCEFLRLINWILLRRKSSILGKEANLFTTNVDVFLDKALEDVGLEYNDGFNGRFRPTFSLSNFKKSRFKKSAHYDNESEIPVFNLLKLHGSLTWQTEASDSIVFSSDLGHVSTIQQVLVPTTSSIEIRDDSTIEILAQGCVGKTAHASVEQFFEAYHKLLIVNPTKEKFSDSLLNQTYYELLRMYSNELEKENTVLFVMGFSFADEHIREITLRAANSNPTLIIYVIAHTSAAAAEMQSRFGFDEMKNNNLVILAPKVENGKDAFKYDLPTINRTIFRSILEGIRGGGAPPKPPDNTV